MLKELGKYLKIYRDYIKKKIEIDCALASADISII